MVYSSKSKMPATDIMIEFISDCTGCKSKEGKPRETIYVILSNSWGSSMALNILINSSLSLMPRYFYTHGSTWASTLLIFLKSFVSLNICEFIVLVVYLINFLLALRVILSPWTNFNFLNSSDLHLKSSGRALPHFVFAT